MRMLKYFYKLAIPRCKSFDLNNKKDNVNESHLNHKKDQNKRSKTEKIYNQISFKWEDCQK
jgi:hypothetical protein